MGFNRDLKKNVRKFILDAPDEREEYEQIINDPNCVVYNENFTYDKAGHAVTTIWYYTDPDDDDESESLF